MRYWTARARELIEAQLLLFPGVPPRPGEAARPSVIARAKSRTAAQVKAAPWTVDAYLWMLYTKGEEGKIATQHGMHLAPGEKKAIGKRGRAYMTRQWHQKTRLYEKFKREWEKIVLDAWNAGKIDRSKGISQDARAVIEAHIKARAEQKKETERRAAKAKKRKSAADILRKNRIPISELKKGDRVFLYRIVRGEPDKPPYYVARRFRKSVHLSREKGGDPIRYYGKPLSFGENDYLFGKKAWPQLL